MSKQAQQIILDTQKRSMTITLLKNSPILLSLQIMFGLFIPFAISDIRNNREFETQGDLYAFWLYVVIAIILGLMIIASLALVSNRVAKEAEMQNDLKRMHEEYKEKLKEEEVKLNRDKTHAEAEIEKYRFEQLQLQQRANQLNEEGRMFESVLNFAIETVNKNKHYQRFTNMLNATGLVDEIVSLSVEAQSISESFIHRADSFIMEKIKTNKERVNELRKRLSEIPLQIEQNFKSYLKGVDLDGDGTVESIMDEIRGVFDNMIGKREPFTYKVFDTPSPQVLAKEEVKNQELDKEVAIAKKVRELNEINKRIMDNNNEQKNIQEAEKAPEEKTSNPIAKNTKL